VSDTAAAASAVSVTTAASTLHDELAAISGLDVEDGVSHIGGSREGYHRILRQFCEGFDEGMATIRTALEKEDWKDYAIRLHAYKGVFATLGQKPLSEWARKLEFAGKAAETAVCAAETAPVIAAMTAFRDALLATTLFPKDAAVKTKIAPEALAAKLAALSKACAAYKSTEASEIAATLANVSLDEVTDTALSGILALVASLDYGEAVEKIALCTRA
jgi:HPt (histidine-containing phosphotransfer) domain-containing protein